MPGGRAQKKHRQTLSASGIVTTSAASAEARAKSASRVRRWRSAPAANNARPRPFASSNCAAAGSRVVTRLAGLHLSRRAPQKAWEASWSLGGRWSN